MQKNSTPLGHIKLVSPYILTRPSWDHGICFLVASGGFSPTELPGDSGVSPEEVMQSLGHCAPEYRTAGGG